MKINFMIGACTEFQDTFCLINMLQRTKDPEDEIMVILDSDNTNQNMISMIKSFGIIPKLHPIGNFKSQFEQVKQYWQKDLIFVLCPDEMVSYLLLKNIKQVFIENPHLDGLAIPRVNIFIDANKENVSKMYVGNRSQNHILDQQSKHPEGWINWPDYQVRIFKPEPYIQWGDSVHSAITGFKCLGAIPSNPALALIHTKTIEHQERMLKLYDKIEPNN